jgi:hypothetical protein
MKVKVLRKFEDLKENKLRIAGDTFVVSQERFKEINSTKYGILVEAVEENK